MKLIIQILKDLRCNYLFYILSFCLISSSIVIIPSGMVFYTIGLIILLCIGFTLGKKSKNSGSFILFLVSCFFSSLINNVWNYRLFVFMLLTIACTPILDSLKLFEFRRKYLFYSLAIFPLLSIASVYCFFTGINMFTPDITDFEYGVSGYDFSAFYNHPMWLAASVGLANVVYTWLLFKVDSFFYKSIIGVGLFLSVIISFASGSRSALISSIIAMYTIVFLMSGNTKKVIIYTSYVVFIAFLLLPFYMNYSQRMVMKMEAGEGKVYGSRTEIFVSGFKHFWDNPMFGTGFATQWRAGKFYIGLFESGSGWLSIFFQLGLFGTSVMGILLSKLRKIRVYIHSDKYLVLYLGCFIFLCAHSCFEGYILTSGYYLCILFWTLLGYMISYPCHVKKQ